MLDRRPSEMIRLDALESSPIIEKSEQGYQILPDRSWLASNAGSSAFKGAGPMYFSLIRKIH